MLGDIRQAQKVYIVCGYTDMRKGLNSLVPFVQQNFGIDPYSSSLFLFCGKRCDRLKALLWEPDGFVLLYKRLDNGRSRGLGDVYKRQAVGTGWVCTAVQAVGQWSLSVATECPRSQATDLGAVHLAHAGAEH